MDNQSFAYNTNPPEMITPLSSNAPTPTEKLPTPENKTPIGLIVGLVVAIVFACGFAGLSAYLYLQYSAASTDLAAQIKIAVDDAVKENSEKLESEYLEREKNPNNLFAGPVDYGELSFSYPKTWSVYIGKDAVNGGDFEAYLNPGEVNPVSKETINALRVSIVNQSYEKVISDYSKLVSKGELELSVIDVNGASANRYEGNIDKNIKGIVTIFKIRDKVVIVRTDAELFTDDYNRIIQSIKFNS